MFIPEWAIVTAAVLGWTWSVLFAVEWGRRNNDYMGPFVGILLCVAGVGVFAGMAIAKFLS